VHDETQDHLTLQCPFAAQEQYGAAQRLGFTVAVPLAVSEIPEWWPQAVVGMAKHDAKNANSFIMLTMRSLWLERNARVFGGVSTSTALVIDVICIEWAEWIACRRGHEQGGG
jgi:hypothetical protein